MAHRQTYQRRESAAPEMLDGDMRPSDVIAALWRLKFAGDTDRQFVELDEAARNFLIGCVEARCRK
jgi:hypothetical protein